MKHLVLCAAVLCMVIVAACSTQPTGVATQGEAPALQTLGNNLNGNGFPSGPHYNLNIIGVSKEKTADMTGNNGHRIFVKLQGNTKINLSEGDDYQVLDANGTDGTAEFQLPNPDPDNDGITEYSVYARALGGPGGSSTTTTCAFDADGTQWCSSEHMVLVRSKGKSTARNVSKELLYIYADLDGDGHDERYPLFDDALQDYYWSYDNNGLKLAQLRFYEIPTDVN
jgi:hypothetical protein